MRYWLKNEQQRDPQAKALQEQGILIKNTGLYLTQDFKQYIPQSLREQILEATHTKHQQHYGTRKTTNMLTERYWWPNMRTHIRHFIQECEQCQRNKSGQERRIGLQQAIQAQDAMDLVQIDAIGPLDPTEQGNRYILTYLDTFTRLGWATPLRRLNSPEVAQAIGQCGVLHLSVLPEVPSQLQHHVDTFGPMASTRPFSRRTLQPDTPTNLATGQKSRELGQMSRASLVQLQLLSFRYNRDSTTSTTHKQTRTTANNDGIIIERH
eukprot:Blabericola_migrator_1__5378@NODE_2755_length_2389_cov_14_470715_g1724_i0_p2_GENE_NODE_2755_length_2389_cov_14_470715_g1724_i0NODE_2755_length_2389_cov_14_470715_g1724_i0_p2_ORF_typecomplete_len266_score13_53Integrase_H2C2/PF17921_1/1e17zfH2C2/PF09337_10/5_5e09rve/PF00665_26/5_5e03rve/PF00665_26/8_5e05DUF2293/PF10056_9/0_0066HTH_21/PF13276_6/0_07_NODE_2755_length_2389_cov_14_470715_g1724_i013002097